MRTWLPAWFITAGAGLALMVAAGMHFGVDGLPPALQRAWNAAMPSVADINRMARNAPVPSHPGVDVLAIGDQVPTDFTLPDLNGKLQTLAQYRGKKVLLNFWATWCAPCREEMPELARAQQRHPGIRIIGIAMDKPAAVRRWLEHTPVPYPIWMGLADGHPDPTLLFNDRQGLLPYSVLLSANGRIEATHLGKLQPGDLDAWLR